MSIQTKTMSVKSDTSIAETTTTIRDTVTFDVSDMPNGITYRGLKAVLSFADPIRWNGASTYDALTVVWDDATHASYASRRPVPRGIELANEFYWFRTADLDAQVEMYRQEVMGFDARIAANTANISENTLDICPDVLFIGDSYMEGYSPDGALTSFAETVRNKLELSSNRHAHIVCKGGYSFVNGNWLSLLTEWVDSQTDETLNSIGDIYICGGANDRHSTSKDITDGQRKFFSYCRTKFPNARYTVFFIGAGCVGKAVHTDVLNSKFANVVNSYSYNSFMFGYSFINGSGIIKFNKYLSSDYFHPNQNGQNWLAANLFNIVNGGNQVFTYGEHFPGIKLFDGKPDFQNNGDDYKLASGTFRISAYNPDWNGCAGAYPWSGYELSDCTGQLVFDTSGVSQDWTNRTLEICTLPNEAIYQAPTGNVLDIVRQWPVSVQYQLTDAKKFPTGVDNRTFFTDSGTLLIHGNKVYLNLRLVTPLRASSESAYLKLPIAQLIFTVLTDTKLPDIPEQ